MGTVIGALSNRHRFEQGFASDSQIRAYTKSLVNSTEQHLFRRPAGLLLGRSECACIDKLLLMLREGGPRPAEMGRAAIIALDTTSWFALVN